ncbi:MAG: DUF1028 domain-containing protein [Saprospiraceae bacterium]
MKPIQLIILPFLFLPFYSHCQNLPSLLTQRNIQSTFSITAYDPEAREWGIAVATDNIYVGSSTIYIEPGVGAFSVIAETEPRYGIEGLERLKQGESITQILNSIRQQDNEAKYRQVAAIDAKGNTAAFTGTALRYWDGHAGHLAGKNHIVIGNQLADSVLVAMSYTFMQEQGTLAERLLAALLAGQAAGGQITGKQSAALTVKGVDNEWFNQIDLRVDNAEQPFAELQQLLNYHYGRIRLNQSFYALRAGNSKRAIDKLKEGEQLLTGWYGIYDRLAMAHYQNNQTERAVELIQTALINDANWKNRLPAFYFLRSHPTIKLLINPADFSLQDWQNALQVLLNLERNTEAIRLGTQLIKQQIESSYLYYLIAKAHDGNGNQAAALKYVNLALKIDDKNIKAEELKTKLTQ